MRLDRYLSQYHGLTRKQASQRIRAGEVTVDGEPARDPGLRLSDNARIAVAGTAVEPQTDLFLMLHKPADCISASRDSTQPTLLDLLPPALARTPELQVVGRLDKDTTGLILLTTDGAWNHRITAPRSRCSKAYWVTLSTDVTDAQIERLTGGIRLRGESHATLPCTLTRLTGNRVEITLYEGRYHQIKRMFAAVDNHVVALHRVRIGGIVLPDDLPPGCFRPLTEDELASL